MYDIPELEKKWKKYRRKKLVKPILFTLITLIIIGGGVIGFKFFKLAKINIEKKTTNTVTKQDNNSSSLKNEEKAIVIKKISINKKTQDNNIDLSNAEIIKPNVPDDEIRVIGFDNKEKKEIVNKYKDIIAPNKKNIQIDPIAQEYEEKFQETQDPKDSLFLAKYFYKKGNYKKAEFWAMKTNDIDGEIEDSWLIFAKSRAKQGYRVEAIKILQEYYDNTSSLKAKELLDKLRRNKPF